MTLLRLLAAGDNSMTIASRVDDKRSRRLAIHLDQVVSTSLEAGRMKASKIFLAGVIAFAAMFTVRSILHAQPAPNRIQVTANKYAFEPTNITAKKGQPFTLVLHSIDTAHGLRFRELNVDVKAGKGKTAETTFTPQKTGDFVGHCSVFCGSGHGSMKLTLHVTD